MKNEINFNITCECCGSQKIKPLEDGNHWNIKGAKYFIRAFECANCGSTGIVNQSWEPRK